MYGSPSLISVERDYLDELIKKATAWDKQQERSRDNNLVRLADGIYSSVGLGSSIDVARAVPFNQTIVATNLPSSIRGADLMNSFLATGGIRYYQLFLVPGRDFHRLTALITFVTPGSAKNYVSYVSSYGFFLSKRLYMGYNAEARTDEYLYTSSNKKFQCLFTHAPDVIVKPWLGTERISGKLITGDEGGYCNVSHAIENEGATRSLLIIPGMESKELQEELKCLIAIPELRIESSCFRAAMAPWKGMVTLIRFYSVRDAVMVKDYLSLLRSFSSAGGKMVKYARSPTEMPTENLGWHNFPKPREQRLEFASKKPALDTTRTKNDAPDFIPTIDKTPPTDNSGLLNYPYKSADSDAGDSDSGSDTREISFSLAKEAFLPHIPTSPNRTCYTSLCHTPVPGDCTPTQSEHTGKQPILENKVGDLATSATITTLAGIESDSGPQYEITPSKKKYPHENYLPKKFPEKYVDSHEIVKSSEEPRGIEDSRYFTPQKDSIHNPGNTPSIFQHEPLGIPSIEISKPTLLQNTSKRPNGLENATQKSRKGERLLNPQQAPNEMKAQLANELGSGKQTLKFTNVNQGQVRLSESRGNSLKTDSRPRDDELLGGWSGTF